MSQTRKVTVTNYDKIFKLCYSKNIQIIQNYILKYSGIHAIDTNRANRFINNQLSQVRRQAAKDLIDNTIYITLQDVSNTIELLMDNLYKSKNITDAVSNNNHIYFYSGDPKKSFFFLNVLALYYIRKHGWKEPIFINNLTDIFFKNNTECPIILLDDVSYSGSQMTGLLNNIYYKQVVVNTMPPPKIIVALIALNTVSLKKMQTVYTKKTKFGIFLNEVVSPFEIIYLSNRLYSTLVEKIGEERYNYINLFFSPFTEYQPYISLYLDHKIADTASTYMKALLYGPIIPSNYKEQYQMLIIQLSDEQLQYSNKINIANIIKTQNFDIIDSEYNIEIEFYPFIKSCFNNIELTKIIRNKNIKNMEYILFVATEDINELLNAYIEEKDEIMSMSQYLKLSKMINIYKCPNSFYKDIPFLKCSSYRKSQNSLKTKKKKVITRNKSY